jgi:hypothetical protein
VKRNLWKSGKLAEIEPKKRKAYEDFTRAPPKPKTIPTGKAHNNHPQQPKKREAMFHLSTHTQQPLPNSVKKT